MEKSNFIFNKYKDVILIFTVVISALAGRACSQTNTSVLLLQQTPANGGEVAPGVGVHHFDIGSRVTLTAIPQPGYQFVYWIGDVSNPTANNTIVNLDTPKIIIAVFEEVEYEYLPRHENELWSFSGIIHNSAVDYKRQGRGGMSGTKLRKPMQYEEPEYPEYQEFPIPVPEPMTAVLFGLGSLLALRSKSRRQVRKNRQ
ncbi:MAG: PEP-CTERM sorting domain-containing protein [Planctomycetes bacterium]|nr:PEP-CTERM sorting domain-containing protein [Planctomycetota bacterium]